MGLFAVTLAVLAVQISVTDGIETEEKLSLKPPYSALLSRDVEKMTGSKIGSEKYFWSEPVIPRVPASAPAPKKRVLFKAWTPPAKVLADKSEFYSPSFEILDNIFNYDLTRFISKIHRQDRKRVRQKVPRIDVGRGPENVRIRKKEDAVLIPNVSRRTAPKTFHAGLQNPPLSSLTLIR